MLGCTAKKNDNETEEAGPKKVKNGYEVKIINAKSGKQKIKKSGKESDKL